MPSVVSFAKARLNRVLLALALSALGVGGIQACSSAEHPSALGNSGDTNLHGPLPGSPCDQEGASQECGKVERTYGTYVTCSMGHQTCQGGFWSACNGDHFVVQSMPNLALGGQGLHQLSTKVACTNVCDPWCVSTHYSSSDVDAGGIMTAPDGGLTLEKSDGGVVKPATKCNGLQCNLVTCAMMGATTTISGTVYDPAGNNPLYNANVYIPLQPKTALPAFSSGASCDTCSGAGSLDAIRATQTDANGNFTLSDVPAGANIPVIVQMGKWRREILLTNVTSCTNNTVKNNCTAASAADCVFRLPKNHTDGYDPVAGTYTKADVPTLAIVSGSADPFDCLLLKAGLDPNEFGDNTSSKRFHYYQSDSKPGNKLNSAYGSQVVGSTLWNSKAAMMAYDAILLPCEGAAVDKQTTGTTPYKNLIDYTNSGGRAFATHYSYVWLEYPSNKSYVAAPDNWGSVAKWTHVTGTTNTQDPLTGVVDTSFPKGATYSTWLQAVAATSAPSKLIIHEGRQDLTTIGASAQGWMNAHDNNYATAPDFTTLFTFNTPYAATAANQCGRVVFSDFHVSANALMGSTNQCILDSDCGFSATCVGSKTGGTGQCAEPCDSPADCPSSSYACTGAVTGKCNVKTCSANSDCLTGETCKSGQCTCSAANAGAECSSGTCGSMTCNAGHTCTSNADCGLGTCSPGTCSKTGTDGAGSCHKNTDCGLGTCGGGSNNGTCAAGAACHTNANCGASGTCGSGTGATLGNCSSNGMSCHSAAGCDSNSCAGGTCSSSLASCHKDLDCDSGACGSGSGAVGTCSSSGATCHSSATCDSGSCGGGSCSTSGQTCHAAADCDGGVCGATKGVCSRVCASGTKKGTMCSKNSDCGSGVTCSSATACSVDTDCATSGSACTGAVCSTVSCASDGACGKSLLCNGAKCTSQSCSKDAACLKSGLCNGATCASQACGADSACGKSNLCNGATCGATTCAGDSACGVSKLCNGAKCGSSSCANDSQCATGTTCSGAKCTSTGCFTKADCGTYSNNVCSTATCTSNACASNADCGSKGTCGGGKCATDTCVTNADCGSGVCNAGVCGCLANDTCGSEQTCDATQGSCSKSCTSNSDCAPDLCIGGKCGGCTSSAQCNDNVYSATCTGINAANYGTCSKFTSGEFPAACRQGLLSAQEKALEFMFFDLTACVSPDGLAPAPPTTVLGYYPATFVQDVTASCGMGMAPIWREIDWQATIPSTASVVITAQSGDTLASLLPASPVQIVNATASTNVGASGTSFDAALIDAGTGGSAPFNLANVGSRNILRLSITLNPTPDMLQTPTLLQWKVQYDCAPAE